MNSFAHQPIRLQKLTSSLERRGLSRRRQETQLNLLAAAGRLFAEQGIGGTTVEQISEEAGYTRGAFYSNFRDIHALLIALTEAEDARLVEHIEAAAQRLPEVLTAHPVEPEELLGDTEVVTEANALDLAAFADHWIASLPLTRHDVLLRGELATHAIRSAEFQPHFVQSRARLIAAVSMFLQTAQPYIQLTPIISLEEISQIMISLVERAAKNQLVNDPHGTPLSSVSAQLLLPVLRGLLRAA